MNRPLSVSEHLLWFIDQAVPQNFVIVARLSHPEGSLIKFPSLLRQATEIIQQRYPSLKCKIKGGKAPKFVTRDVPPIPLHIIRRENDSHWIQETENQMLEPLPWTKGPLVRLILLDSPKKWDLLVTLCHVTADATSGLKFLKHLLTIANKLSRGEMPTPELPLPELPPVTDLLSEEVKQQAETLKNTKITGYDSFTPIELQGDKYTPPEKRITRIIQKILSKTETKKLIVKSRREQASMHSTLCAALMQTMVEEIRLSQQVLQKGPLLIGCITPVNIRHLFKQPIGENLGNFISNALHYQLIDNHSSLWEAARETKKSLQEQLEAKKDINALLGAVNILKPNETPIGLISRIKDTFPPTGVTNLGQLDIPERFGDFILENLHYNPSINPFIKDGFAISVSGLSSHTTLNFLYAEPYISSTRAKRMVERTIERLKNAS